MVKLLYCSCYTADAECSCYTAGATVQWLQCRCYAAVAAVQLLLLLLLKKVGSASLKESDIHHISPKTPAPQYQPLDRTKRKGKRVEDYSRDRATQANKKSTGPTLGTRQSHTIVYWVRKIVPEIHREGNKSPVVLRGSAASRCISVPMCDQSTTCNPHWHIRSRQSTIKKVLHYSCYSAVATAQFLQCSCSTAVATLQLLQCICYSADATLQMLHCSCYTAVATLQLLHCSCYTAYATVQMLHCSCYTAVATVQILHCSCYSADATLQLLQCRCQ